MPANSATTLVPFAMMRTIIARTVQRTPKRSRMRSERPCPVTSPMREHISWITPRPMLATSRSHSSEKPNSAPTEEYVVTPPASFPANPVITPGPTTVRNAARAIRRRLT